MNVSKYNKIIEYVDENIKEDRRILAGNLASLLLMNKSDLSDLFRFVDSEERTLFQYITQRKIQYALKDFVDGMTKEDVVNDYSLNERTFNDNVKDMYDEKVPSDFRETGYEIPSLKYAVVSWKATDSIEDSGLHLENEEDHSDMEYSMQDLQEENKKLSKQVDDLEMMLVEEKANKIIGKEKDEKRITLTEYYNFLEIEQLRRMYGFEVGKIMELYNESLRKGKDLEELCDFAMDDLLFEHPENDYSSDYPDPEDEEGWREFYNNEGTIMENWEYYFGNDEVLGDPEDDDADIWF